MSDEKGGNSRSDRLRRRRSAGKQEASEPGETGEPSETSQPSKPSKPSETTNIKEVWDSRYLYVEPGLNDEIEQEFKRLQYRCSEIDLEKMRHYYAMLLRVGLERIQEMDGEEFEAELEERGLL